MALTLVVIYLGSLSATCAFPLPPKSIASVVATPHALETSNASKSHLFLARQDGDDDAESYSVVGTCVTMFAVWMFAGLCIFACNASREEEPEFGLQSAFCAFCLLPIGCIACCLPIDSPATAFFSSDKSENRRLLGRGTTRNILMQEATLFDAMWKQSLLGVLFFGLIFYALYAGTTGINAGETCPDAFVPSALLLAKAVAMVGIAAIQFYIYQQEKDEIVRHAMEEMLRSITNARDNASQEELALRQWLKKLLILQKVLFLFSLCCTSVLLFAFPEPTTNDDDAPQKPCFAMQQDCMSWFMAGWVVQSLAIVFYSLKCKCEGRGDQATCVIRDAFLKVGHLIPL